MKKWLPYALVALILTACFLVPVAALRLRIRAAQREVVRQPNDDFVLRTEDALAPKLRAMMGSFVMGGNEITDDETAERIRTEFRRQLDTLYQNGALGTSEWEILSGGQILYTELQFYLDQTEGKTFGVYVLQLDAGDTTAFLDMSTGKILRLEGFLAQALLADLSALAANTEQTTLEYGRAVVQAWADYYGLSVQESVYDLESMQILQSLILQGENPGFTATILFGTLIDLDGNEIAFTAQIDGHSGQVIWTTQ